MNKKRTRETRLSSEDINKIAELVKSVNANKINYGIAGAPERANSTTVKRREIAYSENKYSFQRKKITDRDCELLAESNVLLRIALEYNKSVVSSTSYTFSTLDNKENRLTKSIQEFFRFPDGETNFKSFLKQLVEDMLVTDSVSIYNEINKDNETLAVQVLDGTLIKPVVDVTGKTVFYQMKNGREVTNLSKDELIYYISNKRTKSKEGFSKVRQVYQIATLFDKAMRDIEDYYDGNVGNFIASVKGLQASSEGIQALDALTALYEERRNNESKHNLTLFADADFHKLKDVDLKNNIHDFYIRIICAVFNVPYQYFIAEVNRATAETSKSTTDVKGMRDVLDNIENIINLIIKRFLKVDNVEFKFVVDVPVDADKLATRLATLVQNKLITINEARKELGYTEIEGGNELITTSQKDDNSPTPDVNQDDNQGELNKSLTIKKATLDEETKRAFDEAEKALSVIFADLLATQREKIVQAVKSGETITFDFLQELELTDEQAMKFIEEFSEVSKKVSVVYLSRIHDIYNINNVAAFDIALSAIDLYNTERSASLIGKQIRNGVVVANPNSAYAITETTRASVQSLIDKAMQQGMSNQALAKELEVSFDFSAERAMNIAVTETNSASNYTAMKSYESAGIDEVVWSTTYNDDKVCETCLENEKQGPIKIGKAFKSGVFNPPAHPNCRCTVNPYFKNYTE